MTVLVTGGTGLIGSAVVEALAARGDRIVVLTRKAPEDAEALLPAGVGVIRADIRDRDAVLGALRVTGADRVVHMAACLDDECERDPAAAVAVNIDGTVNLLAAATVEGVKRFVFASSIALYGPGEIVFAEETLPVGPVSLYGQTKRLGETLCEKYRALHGIDCVAMRSGGVFGPGGEVRNSGMSGLRHGTKPLTR